MLPTSIRGCFSARLERKRPYHIKQRPDFRKVGDQNIELMDEKRLDDEEIVIVCGFSIVEMAGEVCVEVGARF